MAHLLSPTLYNLDVVANDTSSPETDQMGCTYRLIFRVSNVLFQIQHSFTPNCEMDDFEHPRFGDIKCVATLRPIKAGEELTIHYEYELNTAPIWCV